VKNYDEPLPNFATVLDVKTLSVMDFYTFYIKIMECESNIKNYVRGQSAYLKSPDSKIKATIGENECIMCMDAKVDRVLKCGVFLK